MKISPSDGTCVEKWRRNCQFSHHFHTLQAPHPLKILINPVFLLLRLREVSSSLTVFFLHAGRHVFLIKACSNNDFICAFAWQFECGKISSRTISADSADTFDFISVPFNSHEEKILLWILDESTYKYWVNQWKV